MSDMSQAVALPDGTLSPDMRVNYEFGLVLGVNEFRQEQEYFLEKDYLYNRELHGYGIVSGLDVTSDKVGEDVQISVKPGMAIDKWGRPIVVRDTQCARLAAWLAKWEQDNATSSPPVKVSDKLDKDGNGKLYVVVSHDECLDMLVPIAGQLCGSSETTQAQSRVRDFYNIELRWDAPAMPAWDAARCFARLMSLVRIVPELPPYLSDEDKIIEQVQKLGQSCPDDGFASATDPNTRVFRLPATEAREALDRIFAVWTTDVRPNLRPDLLTTGADSTTSDAAFLLAQLDFMVTISDGTSPRFTINYCQANKNLDGKRPLPRPFLLHSQLVQELLLLSQEQKPEREFATLEVLNAHRLRVWMHHTLEQLVIPPGETKDWSQYFQLKSDDAPITVNGMVAVDNTKNVFDLTTADRIVPGARVELTFRLDKLTLQSGRTLQESIDTLIYDYVGHDRIANTITTGVIAAPILPAFELVTISTVAPTLQEPTAHLSLWFHTSGGPVKLPPTIEAQRFVQGAAQPVTFSAAVSEAGGASAGFSYFWDLRLTGDVTPLAHKELLSFAFNTDDIHVGTDAQTLTYDIQDAPHSFLGYDGAHTLHTFYEIDNPPSEREFATLEARDSHTLRVWIHTPETLAVPSGDKVDWSQYFQLKSDDAAINLSKMAAIENTQNVFDLTTDALLPSGARIELTFLLAGLLVEQRKVPLQESINALDYEYVGYDRGTGTITVYTIVEHLLPLREFATLEVLNAHNLRFWLHHPELLTLDTHGQALPLDEQFRLKSEGQTLSIAIITGPQPNNSFILTTKAEQPLVPGARIELAILLDGLATDDDKRTPLQERINALGIEYVGHDLAARTITAYTTAERLQTLELVTFRTVLPTDQDPAPHLSLWFHTRNGPVKLPAQITGQRLVQGASQNIAFNASTSDSSGFSYTWELRPQDTALSHKDLLTFALDTDAIHVSTDQRTLTFEIQQTQQFYRGYDGDHTLYAFYEVDSPPQPQQLPPPGPSLSDILNLPAQPFVTITPVANAPLNFELWFHLNLDAALAQDQNSASNATFIQGSPVIKVFAEQGGNDDRAPSMENPHITAIQRNVFTLALPDAAAETKAGTYVYLRLVFPVEAQEVQVAPGNVISLRDYIVQQSIKFEGYNGKDAIIAYVRVPSA